MKILLFRIIYADMNFIGLHRKIIIVTIDIKYLFTLYKLVLTLCLLRDVTGDFLKLFIDLEFSTDIA